MEAFKVDKNLNAKGEEAARKESKEEDNKVDREGDAVMAMAAAEEGVNKRNRDSGVFALDVTKTEGDQVINVTPISICVFILTNDLITFRSRPPRLPVSAGTSGDNSNSSLRQEVCKRAASRSRST